MEGKEDEIAFLFKDANSSGQPDWTRNWMRMGENQSWGDLRPSGYNDVISSLWVHPRISLYVTRDSNFGGVSTYFSGSDQQSWGVDALRNVGMQDSISSVRTISQMSADQWKLSCCRHENTPYTSQQKCGKYWKQSPGDCGTMGCTGDTLLTDPLCKTWCTTNPVQCDALKYQWCQQNPDHWACGCINDTKAARDERSKYPTLTGPRQCWGKSDCQKSDMIQTLIPTDLRPVGCPDINAQIQEISNSVIANSNLSQSIQQTKNNDQPQTQSSGVSWLLILIFVIIVTIIGLGGLLVYEYNFDMVN